MNLIYNEIATLLLEKTLLFSTPFSISADTQNFLINAVLEDGHFLPPEEKEIQPFWVGLGLSHITDQSLINNVASENHGWWYYLSRLDPSISWTWNDHPAARVVQDLLSPLAPYFSRFTRVTIVIQRPGLALPAHRDIVVGDEYDFMQSPYSTYKGTSTLRFKGKEWFAPADAKNYRDIHKSQFYLNLKIPLSQRIDSPGKPFILMDGKKVSYSSNNNIFFLNEALIEHGGDPCSFYRGVVFVDGFLNLDKFADLPREKINVLDIASVL